MYSPDGACGAPFWIYFELLYEKYLEKIFTRKQLEIDFGKLSFWIIFLDPACQLSFSTMKACHAERGPRQRAVVLPTIVIARSLRLESGGR